MVFKTNEIVGKNKLESSRSELLSLTQKLLQPTDNIQTNTVCFPSSTHCDFLKFEQNPVLGRYLYLIRLKIDRYRF